MGCVEFHEICWIECWSCLVPMRDGIDNGGRGGLRRRAANLSVSSEVKNLFFTGQRLTEQTLGRAAQLERSVVTNLKSLTDRSSLLSRRPQTGTGKAMEARSSSCDPRIW